MISWAALVTLAITISADGPPHKNAFLELVKSEFYMDKTEFILKFHEQKYPIYFTAPRRFAKTINLSMLKAFYQAKVNMRGERLPREASEEYKAFAKLRDRSKSNSSIMSHKAFFEKNFSSRPVISVSFKWLDVSSTENFLKSFAESISDAYQDHEYLYTSSKLILIFKDLYRTYTNKFENKTKIHLIHGLRQLSALLTEHYETRCMVLIDDFDAPLIKLFTGQSQKPSEILTLLQDSMASLLNDNENVLKTLLTGNLRWATIYGPFNIFSHPYTKNEQLARFFGMTLNEIKSLVKSLEREDPLEDIVTFEHYYEGYNLETSRTKLWCPNSVFSFLTRPKPLDYWSNKESQDILKAVLRHKVVDDFIEKIFLGKKVPWKETTNIGLDDVESYHKVFAKPKLASLTEDQLNFVKQLLMELGYLTVSKSGVKPSLVLPNQEVKLAIMDCIID